ncbi:MAG: class I SAM-dependent methyltransferase [Candidatus Micrarchaeia archaeon]|jgi:ubiquinone/menaquinone biosynthesis C-methylase UbiE
MGSKEWDEKFRKAGALWGEEPSLGAKFAAGYFAKRGVRTVLDVACGYGKDSVFLAKSGFEVTGVDFSLEGLRLAGERAMAAGVVVKWMPADVRMLQMPNGSFDAVLCNNIMTLFIRQEREKAAAEIERVLARGGSLVVSERSVAGKPKKAREVEPNTFADEEHLHHYFSKEEMEKLFAGIKFEKTSEENDSSEKEARPHLLMAGFRK